MGDSQYCIEGKLVDLPQYGTTLGMTVYGFKQNFFLPSLHSLPEITEGRKPHALRVRSTDLYLNGYAKAMSMLRLLSVLLTQSTLSRRPPE